MKITLILIPCLVAALLRAEISADEDGQLLCQLPQQLEEWVEEQEVEGERRFLWIGMTSPLSFHVHQGGPSLLPSSLHLTNSSWTFHCQPLPVKVGQGLKPFPTLLCLLSPLEAL